MNAESTGREHSQFVSLVPPVPMTVLREILVGDTRPQHPCDRFHSFWHPDDFRVQQVQSPKLIVQPGSHRLAGLTIDNLNGRAAHRTKTSAFFFATLSSKKSVSPR